VTPSTEIFIGDANAQHVVLRPLSRTHPGLFDSSDGNWIDCEVHVAVGGFRGSFRAALRSEEFQTFLEEVEALNRTLEGTATFRTLEDQVAITLSGNGKGTVHVSGETIDSPGTGNRLQFGFEMDQTYLPEICRSLEYLLAAFPVIATPVA
jgi:hypothetical protein